jgi:hypothetical protein
MFSNRPVRDVEVKGGLSWSEQVGVLVAMMMEEDQNSLVEELIQVNAPLMNT